MFGAGTDYALLLVARYREELRRHEDRHEAMAFALHRAGPAIFASGATVIAGMLCLLFATMNSTKGLGPVAAIGVAVGLLVMLTLLPALLVICGRWIFWPVRPTYGSVDHTRDGFWAGIGRRIARRRAAPGSSRRVLLAIASLGILQLNAVGLEQQGHLLPARPSRSWARRSSRSTSRPAPARRSWSLANADQAAAVSDQRSSRGRRRVRRRPGHQGWPVAHPGHPERRADSDAATATVDRIRDAIARRPGRRRDRRRRHGDSSRHAPRGRRRQHPDHPAHPRRRAPHPGPAAARPHRAADPHGDGRAVLRRRDRASRALVFRHVFGFAGADSSLPLFVFVFLVALGIDYNIFLMTRVHEEAKQVGTRRGALIGLAATGGVITSAGLVLAGTFAVLATMPVVAFAEIGFAVALGVLLDTLIVRSVLVTALNLDVGGRMWWPSALARRDHELDAATTPAPEEEAASLEPAR